MQGVPGDPSAKEAARTCRFIKGRKGDPASALKGVKGLIHDRGPKLQMLLHHFALSLAKTGVS